MRKHYLTNKTVISFSATHDFIPEKLFYLPLSARSNNSFDICSTSCNALSTIFFDSDDDVFAWPIFVFA